MASGIRGESRPRPAASQSAQSVARVVDAVDLLGALTQQPHRIILQFAVDVLIDDSLCEDDSLALAAETPEGTRELELHGGDVGTLVLEVYGRLELLGSLGVATGTHQVEALLVGRNREVEAEALDGVAEERGLGAGHRDLTNPIVGVDDLPTLLLTNELVVGRGVGLRPPRGFDPLGLLFELGGELPGMLSELRMGGLDLTNSRVGGELEAHESERREKHVGNGAVPVEPALVAGLALGDVFDVRGEGVHEVVGLDGQTPRFDDLLLDLADLLLGFAHERWELACQSRVYKVSAGCGPGRVQKRPTCSIQRARGSLLGRKMPHGSGTETMYETSDIRKGLKVLIDKQPYNVVDFQFVKPGKGQAFTRTKMKNMITGAVLERTFKSGEKLAPADVESSEMQYLYPEGDGWVFMNTKSYDQMTLDADAVGDCKHYLLDGLMVEVQLFDGNPIAVTPPTFVEMMVIETEPGFKGDSTSNVQKPAKMETGLMVQVPLFVEQDTKLKIDTRTGTYVERVK